MKIIDSKRTGDRTGWILVAPEHSDYTYFRIVVSVQLSGQIHFSFRHPDPMYQRTGNACVQRLQDRVPLDVDDLRFAA